jgi:hypothetical protein
MKRFVQMLLASTVLGLSLLVQRPAAAQDDYWTNHWNWYDNTYQPYYYRSYRPAYGGGYYGPSYYGGGYGGGYYGPGYGGYGYGGYGTPYRNYYGTGNVGYGRTYGGGQAINVGPMTFGWR